MRPHGSASSRWILAATATAAAFLFSGVTCLPMQLSIVHREKECLYEYVERE